MARSLSQTLRSILDDLYGDTLIPGTSLVETVTFRKVTRGAYNTATLASGETFGAPVTVETPVKDATTREISAAGGAIQSGDRRFLFRPEDLALVQIGDEVTWTGIAHRVVHVVDRRLDDETILWEVWARA